MLLMRVARSVHTRSPVDLYCSLVFQLALSDKADVKAVWTPTKVHDLDGIGVLKIACCETATIILANDANLYSAGTGGVGQLGHQDMVHEKLTKFRKVCVSFHSVH